MKTYRRWSDGLTTARFAVLVSVLTMALGPCSWAVAEESPAEAEPVPVFNDNPLPMFGLVLGCIVVGPSTCILLTDGESGEVQTYRPREERAIQIGFFPSYVLDFAESKAFQRVEASAFMGNVLTAVSHRRGVQEPNRFSSTSYRLAYSFDWRHVRPAIGLGLRKNVNARNGDALELWFPLFANRSKFDQYEFMLFLETLWIFGPDGLRPEVQLRFEFEVTQEFRLAAGVGYFPDYYNPEMEISVGPILEF